MTNTARTAEYRYFSFTYFYGRLISVWLKACVCKSVFQKLFVHEGPQPTGCGPFSHQYPSK